MKWSCLWMVLLATTVTTAVAAQSPSSPIEHGGDVAGELERVLDESGVAIALDSIAETAAPVLEETLSQLSMTLGDLAERVASDPELRRSAFAAAQGIAQLTSSLVAENADVIQEVLRKAADELDRMGTERTPTEAPSAPPSPAEGEVLSAPVP